MNYKNHLLIPIVKEKLPNGDYELIPISLLSLPLPSLYPRPLPPTIMRVCRKRSVPRGKAPAPAAKKSAGGGGAGGGGGACATSIASPGTRRLPRKANSAAAVSTLAAVSSVVAYKNQLNGGAVGCRLQ